MADGSKIEWTDATWNPIRARNLETGGVGHFCVHESEGCRHCYAERMQPRFKNPIRFAAQDRDKVELFLDPDVLVEPLKWRKPRRVFVCSMTDLFLKDVPRDWIDMIWGVMAMAEKHQFQVLTKRPGRMRRYLMGDPDEPLAHDPSARVKLAASVIAEGRGEVIDDYWDAWFEWPLPNVWIGTSIELPHLWYRAAELERAPAAIRFLSIEPLLGGLGTNVHNLVDMVDWVIVGGESGPNARPMHPDWVREIRDECMARNTPFFFKQWGEWLPGENRYHGTHRQLIAHHQDGYVGHRAPHPLRKENYVRWYGESDARYGGTEQDPGYRSGRNLKAWACKVGKKAAGRELDGRTWDEFPEVST